MPASTSPTVSTPSMPDPLPPFARWAAHLSALAQPEGQTKNPPPATAPAHPFLAELARYQREQRRRYFLAHHYYKIRQRLLRASRRKSHRRGRPVRPLHELPDFAQWHGQQSALAVLSAPRPDPAWRTILPFSGERARQLEADLQAIDRELDLAGMEPSRVSVDGRLAWQIHLMDFAQGRCDLGLFAVGLDPGGQVFISGGDFAHQGYIHPHADRDGRLCTGRFDAMRDWLHRDGALELVFTTVNQILRTYNPGSPYVKLEELLDEESFEECAHCGALLREDEGNVIDGELYCPQCCRWCDGCEQYVSLETEGECFEDSWYCETCAEDLLAHCDHCGSTLLREDALDSPDGRTWCPQCADQCDECGNATLNSFLTTIPSADGGERRLCPDCAAQREETPAPSASTSA